MKNLFRELCHAAGDAVRQYRLIEAGDRILLALSGGKDSLTMLEVLLALQRRAPVAFTLQGVTFDPGFPGFNAAGIGDYCRKFGVEHHIVKCDVGAVNAEKNLEKSPCMLCSRLRRGHLYRIAGELHCNKLALGQHLDDAVISFLMSLCRGQGLQTMAPKVRPLDPEAPAVIRPLILAEESLIAAYSAGVSGRPESGQCRYRETLENGDRQFFRATMQEWEKRIPALRSNLLHSLQHPKPEFLLGLPEE